MNSSSSLTPSILHTTAGELKKRGGKLSEIEKPVRLWSDTDKLVVDASGIILCEFRSKDQAEEMIRAVNSYDAMREALANLVRVNEEWNAAVEKIMGRPAEWNADYLAEAKALLEGAPNE